MLLWRFNWLTFLLSPLTRFWYPPELLKPPQPVTIEDITSRKVGCKLCLGLHSERPNCIIISSLSSSSSSSPSSFIHFIQNIQENPMKSLSQWYTISQRKGKGRGIEVEWGERPWWKGVETGESFDRQERVIIVQMEGNNVPRTERGLAAWWMLSPLSLAKSL